ncbi:PduM family microcompartment protein [Mangrovibacter sp. SLW1]
MTQPQPCATLPESISGGEHLPSPLSASWVTRVVAEVIARLTARENKVFTTSPQQLVQCLAPADFTRYAEVHIRQADNHFLAQLAGQSGGSPAIQSVLGALAWGCECIFLCTHNCCPACLLRHLQECPSHSVTWRGTLYGYSRKRWSVTGISPRKNRGGLLFPGRPTLPHWQKKHWLLINFN